ncbi:MAG: hypothetical protein AVDCRST_MAG42-1561, partial [uncultured Chthoniobacterales bacterium]
GYKISAEDQRMGSDLLLPRSRRRDAHDALLRSQKYSV